MKFNTYLSLFLLISFILLNAQKPENIISNFLRLKNQQQKLKVELKNDISNARCNLKLEKIKLKDAYHQTIALHRSCFAYFTMFTLLFLNTPFMHIKTAQRKQLQIASGSIASVFAFSSLATYLAIHMGQQNTTKKLTQTTQAYNDIIIRSTTS